VTAYSNTAAARPKADSILAYHSGPPSSTMPARVRSLVPVACRC